MNNDTGIFTSDADAMALKKAFGIEGGNPFPADWPLFRVGMEVIIGGVDCKITDIDGRQLTATPLGDVWPKLGRMEEVKLGKAELRVWKVTPKGVVLRHSKQCVLDQFARPD